MPQQDTGLFSGQSYKVSTIINYDSIVVKWGFFQVRYDSRVISYDRRGFIRWVTGLLHPRITKYILSVRIDTFMFLT